ncbi:hypothetical protein M3P05_02315 [Sansalvadorimonas sp. 2012CJ34-2]|uniref:Lipoprotein n=1 Tax=Parendozoicomonas callyspongiae TaxID=2942213 RepID=A0ABT0PBQ2_9GAMM|nr:hypothetical protein [Sansalvadorimonas sp. 2012CJ34-2]MCL6268784.1 hypothetical protein [Sansalvadorimonas sp. 2012CJ34-2]
MRNRNRDLFDFKKCRYFLVPGIIILSGALLNSGCRNSGGGGGDNTQESTPNPVDDFDYSVKHTFSTKDITGGFNGITFEADPSILCDMAGSDTTCTDIKPITLGKNQDTLYPIDSEFGFLVSDFVGAAQKSRGSDVTADYAEGWAADIVSAEFGPGLMVANAKTDVFQAPKLTGTWCAGMGGKLVKCSTEHYVTMEQILACHQTVPYSQDIIDSGEQKNLVDPANGQILRNCSLDRLDDVLKIRENGQDTETILTSVEPGDQMEANESSVRKDIAVSKSYSITLKDDGKPLYRWGNAVKRPNDIRLYVRMALPDEWKEPGAEFKVTKAYLAIQHQITNNPNDQLRPEDMENEGATGRLPTYSAAGSTWTSSRDCYKGDGEFIPAGTMFKNGNATNATNATNANGFSEDLKEGYTVAWYTSINRDPFDKVVDDSGNQIMGPRWRLKSNKFGQDLPSFEVPKEECSKPPYQNNDKKYEVGVDTVTVIDLLNWENGEPSPLTSSLAWVDATKNTVNEISPDHPGVSINGLPLTNDFDLAVYVKGDAKGTRLYHATLVLDYDKM